MYYLISHHVITPSNVFGEVEARIERINGKPERPLIYLLARVRHRLTQPRAPPWTLVRAAWAALSGGSLKVNTHLLNCRIRFFLFQVPAHGPYYR